MSNFCYTINGRKHCFPVAELVDLSKVPRPGPINFPQLELAVTVIGLVDVVEKRGRNSEFGAKLLDISKAFLQEVRNGLPKGVELTDTPARQVELTEDIPQTKPAIAV